MVDCIEKSAGEGREEEGRNPGFSTCVMERVIGVAPIQRGTLEK